MKVEAANKLSFASGLAGIALLKEERVTFQLSGTMVDGRKTTKVVTSPYAAFVSDAQYSVSGSYIQKTRPWSFAPRRAYLISESTNPTPRVYLSKRNTANGVEITLTEITLNGTVAITGNYTVSVDVMVYVSHFL